MEELNTIQLTKLLEYKKCCKKYFRGVYARDKLPPIIKYPSCLILNTQNSNKPGEHWIAIYYDINGEGEFFDPFGLSPEFYGLKSYMDKTSTNWSWNKKQYQPLTSKKCGYYCFIYLIFKCKNISIKDMPLSEKNISTLI